MAPRAIVPAPDGFSDTKPAAVAALLAHWAPPAPAADRIDPDREYGLQPSNRGVPPSHASQNPSDESAVAHQQNDEVWQPDRDSVSHCDSRNKHKKPRVPNP